MKASGIGGRLAVGEKVGYALGDTASNFYWKVFEFYLVYYYTDVFGIGAKAIGTLLLVTRGLDALADPVMGLVADRTQTRWGKFRPYLLWFALPIAAAGVLTFTVPSLGTGGKLAYAYVTYSVLMLLYTAINIPYSALMGVVTASSVERTSLSSFRFAAAFVGMVIVQKATPDLVRALGRGDAARGWQLTMALYGTLAVVLFAICFRATRERVADPGAGGAGRDAGGDLRALLASRAWRMVIGMTLAVLVSFWIRGGATAYFFKYCVRDEGRLGWFLALSGVAGIAGVAGTPTLVRRFGKRRVYLATVCAAAAVTALFFALPPERHALVLATNMLACLLLGPQAPIMWSMYADVADHVEWRSSRRTTALVFATAMFAMKLGGGVGGWSLGWLLDRFGYVPNAVQSAGALRGIALLMSVLPALCLLAAVGFAAAYPLSERRMAEIEEGLARRRASR